MKIKILRVNLNRSWMKCTNSNYMYIHLWRWKQNHAI